MKEPAEEDFENDMVESKLLEIDELFNGDWFGVAACLLKHPIRHSIITTIPTEIFMLDAPDFINLGQDIMDSFFQYMKPYPDDLTLRRAYFEMSKWKAYKKKIVKSIKADRHNTS
jgi:hypothetical protein